MGVNVDLNQNDYEAILNGLLSKYGQPVLHKPIENINNKTIGYTTVWLWNLIL